MEPLRGYGGLNCPECARQGSPCIRCRKDAALLQEEVTKCPLFLDRADFERFMRKVSLHAYAGRPPQAAHITFEKMEARLLQEVIEALPLHYVSVLQDGSRWYRYTFKAKLPQDVLYRVVEKLGIWTVQDPDDDGEFASS